MLARWHEHLGQSMAVLWYSLTELQTLSLVPDLRGQPLLLLSFCELCVRAGQEPQQCVCVCVCVLNVFVCSLAHAQTRPLEKVTVFPGWSVQNSVLLPYCSQNKCNLGIGGNFTTPPPLPPGSSLSCAVGCWETVVNVLIKTHTHTLRSVLFPYTKSAVTISLVKDFVLQTRRLETVYKQMFKAS